MSLFPLLRFFHISAAIVFVGGLFARQAVRSLTHRASDVSTILALTQAAGIVERLMVIPGNILAIAFGLILALVGRAPILGFIQGSRDSWLLVSILILAFLFPLVPLVFLPRGRRFEAALEAARAENQITPALRREMADPVVRGAHVVEMMGVAGIVALMVLKPF